MSGDITINSSGVTAIGSGVIVNADISASAAIALSKLASGSSAQIIVGDASGVPTYRSMSGDISISNTGVTSIASGAIVNADISSLASISLSKLEEAGGPGWMMISDAGGVGGWVEIEGDLVIAANGTATIQDNSVDGTDIAISSQATGSLMYYNGTDWVNLGIGSNGQILKVVSGVPTWSNP